MMKNLNEIKLIIEKSPGFSFLDIEITNNNLICFSAIENIIENIIQLKKHPELKFRQLVDILAVDYPEKDKRFEIIYLLLSHENNLRITVKSELEDKKNMDTLTNVFPSANWIEREVFDMHGISFDNHPDLRRILTDYEFEGYPLRKDFPLTGFKEVRYDPEFKKVKYDTVKLQQDYRDFDFESPWRGSEYIASEQKKVGKLKND